MAASSRQRGRSEEGFQQELKQEVTVPALADRRMLKYFPGQVYYLVINLPLGPSEAKRVMPVRVLCCWVSGSVQNKSSMRWHFGLILELVS